MEEIKYRVIREGDDELMHYGVKGMKWGVRHDKRLTTAARHLSVTRKNYKRTSMNERENADAYRDIEKQRDKVARRMTFSKSAKSEKAHELANLDYSLDALGKTRVQLREKTIRARELYDKDAAAYTKRVKELIAEHGEENVRGVKYRTFENGQREIEQLISSGLTIADIPGFGQLYSNRYLSKAENELRREHQEDLANRKNRSH